MNKLRRIRRLLLDSRGTFTIEASFVMPLILICTLSLLFLALFVFQSSSAQHTAGIAADRTAFIWDNSRRDPITGAFNPGEDDGLYWRLHSDSVSDLFAFLVPNAGAQIVLPTSGASNDSSPENKLRRVGAAIAKDWSGLMQYSNKGLSREVSVNVNRPFHKPAYADKWLLSEVQSGAYSQVVDPVESIRIIDLTRTFISEVKGRITPRAALATFVEPRSAPQQRTVINSHASAARYLQALVNGSEQTVRVHGTTDRQVDALDANEVAHQAFYTFNESQLRNVQMPKDAELLQAGTQIKGVVWHFFKQSSKDTVTLSASFRQELQRKGIVIVIHE
ncbi:hypothetical protein [Paenibacillus agricola]|uniref:Pilus assembly protein n=1 Tax=Paenibacillus agricola TaxID=2716264 RepID=A0ABX0J2X2_9BACL|nr:hypothetical protein [Paenibacillus agricola]NHN30712.1 hypothetical protein [Paenibacillus agricola]